MITGSLQNIILDYTWDSSIGKSDSWLHLEKTLVGKIHFRKIHFYDIEWGRVGRWESAKKLDLRGVELGGKCTYTSEHVQQLLSN